MSIDIQWEKLKGPQGQKLAEQVRSFIHDRFQQVSLPQFIRSVHVHSFDFGDQAPDIEVKDICNPHPDFYGDEDDSDEEEPETEQHAVAKENPPKFSSPKAEQRRTMMDEKIPDRKAPLFVNTVPSGGTSNLAHFHSPYGPGISGSATPLAAVARGHFNWGDNEPNTTSHQHSASISSYNSSDPTSRPTSQQFNDPATIQFVEQLTQDITDPPHSSAIKDPNDLQIVSHVKYSGNMSLVLTAEILLDYPMPSFVGVPFQLHITGFTFDGVSILAYAKKRLHFCFLSPEDALAFLGLDSNSTKTTTHLTGGLLEEIRVESEVGQKVEGKQVLRNVGKIEKFILEQVRTMFENEFVFPSFWTFLV